MVEPWLTMVDHGLVNHGRKHGSHHGWSSVNQCQPWFNHGWPWLTMLPWLMFRLGSPAINIELIVKPINMVNNLNMIYCNNGNGYFSPLRCHRIINTWSILTNEVSKLLWYIFRLHSVFQFEQWLIVLIL